MVRHLALALALALLACNPVPSSTAPVPSEPPAATPEAPHEANARTLLDFAGIDAWLACRETESDLATCEQASAATLGGTVAEAARSGFGPPRTDTPAWPQLHVVADLVASMRVWPDILGEVQPYIPAPIELDVRVYVVANGHGQGDAYVRDGPQGHPVAILNAVLIAAQYKGGVQDKADSALGVLRHELFHAAFHAYRPTAPTWQAWPANPSPIERLQFVVLNEGVGHFADRQREFANDGFPLDRIAVPLAQLDAAAVKLKSAQWSDPEVEDLVRAANQGRYWDKYGSMVGMLLAYGVHRARGPAGLGEAVRCGPGRLVANYMESAPALALPELPTAVAAWSAADLCETRPDDGTH